MVNQKIVHIALLVKNYDEAISFFTTVLDFVLVEDSILSPTKRWVVVKPVGDGNCGLLLAKAGDEKQQATVGNQGGGRVFLFMHTDNCQRDYEKYQSRGVRFVAEPVIQPYGTVAVFEDLYGNRWDLIEPREL